MVDVHTAGMAVTSLHMVGQSYFSDGSYATDCESCRKFAEQGGWYIVRAVSGRSVSQNVQPCASLRFLIRSCLSSSLALASTTASGLNVEGIAMPGETAGSSRSYAL